MTSPSEAPDGVLSPPRPSPSLGLGGLLFRQPEEDEEEFGLSSIPSPSSSPETDSAGLVDDSPSVSDWDSPDSDEPSDVDPSSSPESSRGELPVVGKRSLQRTARQAVKIGTGVAHKFAARTPGQVEAGMYLADDEDASNIGDPLASIAHRRGGVGGKLSPDANDALQALMGLGGYFAKQVARAQLAMQIDAHRAPAEEQA